MVVQASHHRSPRVVIQTLPRNATHAETEHLFIGRRADKLSQYRQQFLLTFSDEFLENTLKRGAGVRVLPSQDFDMPGGPLRVKPPQ